MTVTFGADANPAPNLVQGFTTGIDWKDVKIVNNVLIGTQPGNNAGTSGPPFDDSTGFFINPYGQAWPQDQDVVCDCVITDTGTAGPTFRELAVRLRSACTPHINSGYECGWRCTQDGSQYAGITRWNGPLNDFTTVVDATSVVGIINGYQIRATAIGTVLTMYQRANSSLSWSVVCTHDTAGDTPHFLAGAPGVSTWIRGTTDASKAGFSQAVVLAS